MYSHLGRVLASAGRAGLAHSPRAQAAGIPRAARAFSSSAGPGGPSGNFRRAAIALAGLGAAGGLAYLATSSEGSFTRPSFLTAAHCDAAPAPTSVPTSEADAPEEFRRIRSTPEERQARREKRSQERLERMEERRRIGPARLKTLPTRAEHMERLRADEEYDLIVIGAGITGSGIALDAASRGLKVALIERDDFAAGTSSRSTKLIHGGVRYLERAVFDLDSKQYNLVREALAERKTLLEIAPHIVHPQAILLPVYSFFDAVYYYAGAVCYNLLARLTSGDRMPFTRILSPTRTLEAFPSLSAEGLRAGIVYHDGVNDDARLTTSTVLTAASYGATVVNHTEVVGLVQVPEGAAAGTTDPAAADSTRHSDAGSLVIQGSGDAAASAAADTAAPRMRTTGVEVRDRLTGQTFTVQAKGVINATGPFSDTIRRLDDPASRPILVPSQGIHVVLPAHLFEHSTFGLLDPATSDNRVVFVLPWAGSVLCGTTDTPLPRAAAENSGNVVEPVGPADLAAAGSEAGPLPSGGLIAREADVEWVLNAVRPYLRKDLQVSRSDVRSIWAGVRPLVRDPNNPAFYSQTADEQSGTNTSTIARTHVVHVSPSSLITVSGGKLTTFRIMAKDALDSAIRVFGLTPDTPEAITDKIKLFGAEKYNEAAILSSLTTEYGFDAEVANHLLRSYGDRATQVAALCAPTEWTSVVLPDGTLSSVLTTRPLEEADAAAAGTTVPPRVSGPRGFRLAPDHPYLDGEVRYAVRHEYACTLVDVIARRTRLAFVDVYAAAKVIPTVAAIMQAELGWSEERTKREMATARLFLDSCGLTTVTE
ncbi:hypothetical protein H696_02354 [Fonticula alba]|uniref:glycerol-3-phosphate dehydrogenase n=1 Tax=Fonticula alba TaxID=691883 RepID=A0A058ZD93_FONAL|nr:hypothetical protein H696_02354 [Fonticula alba]KCV71407.1 hypothetical protein H696_02354 [Fonticula alba]|eukprot:XP_009494530.1 hypothetical protein H696_02354 [Fonticula alba]